ncbi:MAG: hypothetical protein SGI74_12680 [Oligoflexia bacterium]|nr:hypothetical protein [Oligoflexia bacterium]
MRQLVLVFAIGLALFQTACPSPKKAAPDFTGRVGDSGPDRATGVDNGIVSGQRPPVTASMTEAVWGEIKPSLGPTGIRFTSGQAGIADEHEIVRWFLSTDLAPEKVGSTSATPAVPDAKGLGCGTQNSTYGMLNANCAIGFSAAGSDNQSTIIFAGNKTLNDAVATPQGIAIQSGKVSIVFWDSLSGINGNTAIPITMPVVQGLVKGNCQQDTCLQGQSSVYLLLKDNFGKVEINGEIIGNQLNAIVTFENTVNKPNPTLGGAIGKLGTGKINACKLMRCR